MSTNTIKITSNEGDKYIAPQQVITYKGITLFGYGYLDWGTVVNQGLVTLIDQIDALQDSGLSEIQFDLTEYEENQKVLRAEEFAIWKTGFTEKLKELVQTYINTTTAEIKTFTDAQTIINTNIQKTVSDNKIALEEEINNISANIDQIIVDTVTNMVSTISETISKLTLSVQQSNSTISKITEDASKVLTEAQQLIHNFQTEFSKTFTTFKDEINNALITNKEFLIKYIDTLVEKSSQNLTDLDQRLTQLELVSDGLSTESVRTMIISKVQEITAGIVATALDAYEDRLDSLDNTITTINSSLPSILKEQLDILLADTLNTLSSLKSTVSTLSKKVNDFDNNVTPVITMRNKIISVFESDDEFINEILENGYKTLDNASIVVGENREFLTILKNVFENVLTQNARNTEKTVSLINSQILNLMDGLNNTKFDELSLIKRYSARTDLFNNLNSEVKTDLLKYGITNMKYNLFFADIAQKTIGLSFKLPNQYVTKWNTYYIRITNVNTSEMIDSAFQITDNVFNLKPTLVGDNLASEIIPIGHANLFQYSFEANSSNLVRLTFQSLSSTDTIKIGIYSNLSYTAKLFEDTLPVSYGEAIDADPFYREIVYPDLYEISSSISKPTNTLQNISWANTNSNIHIPVCDIYTKPDSTKQFAIKIKLPNTATAKTITYTDGYSSYTKTFTNQSTFPVSESEYNSRNLSATQNYYTDICSTGILYYDINSSAKKVTGTITYLYNGVTYTYNFSTSSSGGGSETKIVNSTISSGSYADLSMSDQFGAGTDATNIMVEVRVLETTTSSEVYNKYIKAEHLSSVVWIDSNTIRIYNEYSTSLTFKIVLKN